MFWGVVAYGSKTVPTDCCANSKQALASRGVQTAVVVLGVDSTCTSNDKKGCNKQRMLLFVVNGLREPTEPHCNGHQKAGEGALVGRGGGRNSPFSVEGQGHSCLCSPLLAYVDRWPPLAWDCQNSNTAGQPYGPAAAC